MEGYHALLVQLLFPEALSSLSLTPPHATIQNVFHFWKKKRHFPQDLCHLLIIQILKKRSSFQFQFWGIWMVNHLTNCGFLGWGGAFCWISVATCANQEHKNHKYCYPDKDANLALAAILGSFCILVQAFIIPVYVLYFRNRRAFQMRGGCGCGTK